MYSLIYPKVRLSGVGAFKRFLPWYPIFFKFYGKAFKRFSEQLGIREFPDVWNIADCA